MSQDPNDPNQPAITTGGQTTSCSPSNGQQSTNGQQSLPWVTIVPLFPVQVVSLNLNGVKKLNKSSDDRDGCDCKKCGDFCKYAEPNQSDGTLICYKCRMGW
ncbi:hypothetical protein UFOVP1290_277 [uncultured Caudovirales phage]|uniref:Uncharacterized protein n=1 Tax=uncultured Caudovirales phage TaxID=2100421 RepID=A0A6J5RR40_9CAUD|nr:hypothetical protein UFOVP1290_277 [uncultured Caudovirales phage]